MNNERDGSRGTDGGGSISSFPVGYTCLILGERLNVGCLGVTLTALPILLVDNLLFSKCHETRTLDYTIAPISTTVLLWRGGVYSFQDQIGKQRQLGFHTRAREIRQDARV